MNRHLEDSTNPQLNLQTGAFATAGNPRNLFLKFKATQSQSTTYQNWPLNFHPRLQGGNRVHFATIAPAYLKGLKWLKNSVSLKEARNLHNQYLIFDSHNDTPVERVSRGEKVSSMLQLDTDYQTDVP